MQLSSQPRVSVIIPCFNAAEFVGAAIDSVLAQDYDNLQVLVTDDGSTDDSARVVQAYGDRVQYTWQRNGGISAGRNTSLKKATGQFLAFLDADDLWTPDSLPVRVAALQDNADADYTFGKVEAFFSGEQDGDQRAAKLLPEVAAGRLAGSLLVRSESFAKVGFFDEKLRVGETIDWLLRAQESGLKELALDDVVMLRRVHSSNSVSKDGGVNQQYFQVLRASMKRRKEGVPS